MRDAQAAARPGTGHLTASRPNSGYAWSLELEDSFLLGGGGLRSLGLSLGLRSLRTASGPRLSFDLGLTLRPIEAPGESEAAAASPGAAAPAQAGLLSAAELSAKARLGLELPLRAAARLELEAALEESPLALLGPGQGRPGLELSAAYRAPIGP